MAPDHAHPPTLKCVIIASRDGRVDSLLATLLTRVPADDVHSFGEAAIVVCTAGSAAKLRDLLAPHLAPEASLLVVEFERWSAHGAAVDASWLLRHGH